MPLHPDDSEPVPVVAIGIDIYPNGYYLSMTTPEGGLHQRVFITRVELTTFIYDHLPPPELKETL